MNGQQPNPRKLIFKGRLEFGTERTFNMVVNHWNTRIENYFKSDILLKAEQVFDPSLYALDVPQQVLHSTEKHWRNTTALLEEVAQFALAGHVGAWWVNSGQVLAEFNIEPKTDKTAVSEYQRGCALLQQGGMEMASEALSNAISKFERNALAYERRGYINYKLKNFNDALYDFSKSIDINPANPEPYYGRGKVRMLKNEWDNAVNDFDNAIKRSLAIQPVHWLARLRKGDSLYHAKRYAEAIKELDFFLKKEFSETHPAYRFRLKAEFLIGECRRMLG
jgi:tetratricopeptide (TPR) repeat protein